MSTGIWMDNYSAYLRAGESGDLTARVVGALWWDRDRGAEQIDDLVALRERGRAGRFAATSVKIMQDGVCETFTAAVLEPYLDADGNVTDERGISFVDPEALKGYVTALDGLGFQVHFHALAERAVRECPRRDRGGPATRTARATIATTSPTCRSSIRTTSRGSGASEPSRTRSRSGRRTRARWTT